jgi:restriction system protein
MKTPTIIDAISTVLQESKTSLSIGVIYNKIVEKDYYKFNAQNPQSVVRVELRRHCIGVDFPTAASKKYFQILLDGTYCLINQFVEEKKEAIVNKKDSENNESKYVASLKDIHTQYVEAFKSKVLSQLKEIDPTTFEFFCKKLLKVYGFKDLVVTRAKRDGGIDGFGKLKVGITYLNVAVQCKRWKNTSVGRTEIDKFRGATQGDFEQGILLTTSKFSPEALAATTKKGAVPIILIDGSMIVDIMIEKKFGIDVEDMPIYINALDVVLNED